MQMLLESPLLHVKSENTVFAVVSSWLQGQQLMTKEERQEAFNELAPLIRFPQMTGGFLIDVVSRKRVVSVVELQGLC